ncbi:hypothetical protein BHM03_00052520 [Ensete ventricosum]|nr:hypothetical protein BHM03_00052520 [Ensete ventricosum]
MRCNSSYEIYILHQRLSDENGNGCEVGVRIEIKVGLGWRGRAILVPLYSSEVVRNNERGIEKHWKARRNEGLQQRKAQPEFALRWHTLSSRRSSRIRPAALRPR